MNPKIVGIDPGNYAIKVAGPHGITVLETVVGTPVASKMADYFKNRTEPGGHIITDNGEWYVGQLAQRQSPDPLYPLGARRSADLTLALILAALAENGLSTQDTVDAVTGLPDGWMDTADAFHRTLSGRHHFTYNGHEYATKIQIRRDIVQHAGTFYERVLNVEGKLPRGRYRGTVGVLDIGHGTTGVATFNRLEYIQYRSRSIDKGMSLVHAALKAQLEHRFEMRDLPPRLVRQAIITGKFNVSGNAHGIKRLISAACDITWPDIEHMMRQVWPEPKEMEAVLLAGTSAPLYQERVASIYPVVEMGENSQTTNAEGMRRFALMMHRHARSQK